MAKPPIDPLRAKLLDLIEQITDRLTVVRDHALVPGNSWLARGEVRNIDRLSSELEALLDEIKDADAENGF